MQDVGGALKNRQPHVAEHACLEQHHQRIQTHTWSATKQRGPFIVAAVSVLPIVRLAARATPMVERRGDSEMTHTTGKRTTATDRARHAGKKSLRPSTGAEWRGGKINATQHKFVRVATAPRCTPRCVVAASCSCHLASLTLSFERSANSIIRKCGVFRVVLHVRCGPRAGHETGS